MLNYQRVQETYTYFWQMTMEAGKTYEDQPGCWFQDMPHTQYIATKWVIFVGSSPI